jgi:3-mercaptopyruvate sulfurtransferase SseA
MTNDTDWQDRAKGLLKAELKRRNVSYKDLADKLAALGVDENDRNIANKLARGGFSAVFLIQCLDAIGCNTLHLGG